jgi:IclR family acetate operon transcriptional repressor
MRLTGRSGGGTVFRMAEPRVHDVKRAYPGTQAVVRAVRLLKACAAHPAPRLGDLCRSQGLHKTTAYRLLSALQNEGLLERTEDEAYRLGPEMIAFGNRALGAPQLRDAARRELDALAEATRETATLEVLAGDEVLILDEAMGGRVVGTLPSVGTRWPAHATSTGKVLLAHRSNGHAHPRPLPAFTARTIVDPAVLARELARVRRRGYAVSAEELENGFVAVGAPVHAADGTVVAAISVGGPRTRLTAPRITEGARLVRTAAARISRTLGYTER